MFYLSKLQFEIEMLDDRSPIGFWVTRLRGGYGDVLKNDLCDFPHFKSCEDCGRFAERNCDFPYLFKPHSHLFPEMPSGKPLGRKANLPAPFVINAPFEIDRQLKRGSRVTFDFLALGKTIDRTMRVIDSFGKLGRQGLDVKTKSGALEQARFQLVDVKDMLGGGRSLHALGNVGQAVVRDASELVKSLLPAQMPDEIVISFATPVRIFREEYPPLEGVSENGKGETARGLRDFYDFVKVVANRVEGIKQLYGQNWDGQTEFFRRRNALLKESKKIEIREIELHKETYHRYAKSAQKTVAMDGFVGAIRAAGDFSNLLELILLGELLHIGESTAYGFGQYKTIY
jgi:hypothetical protein